MIHIQRFRDLHPGRLTWNLQITHVERKINLQTSVIMFNVNLPACTMINTAPLITGQKPRRLAPKVGMRMEEAFLWKLR